MKAFLNKYKWAIFIWAILLFFVLYFQPKQNEFYLDKDIRYFKIHYLQPALIWTVVILSIGLFIYRLKKTRSVKQSIETFLSGVFMIAVFLFIYQGSFLAVSLFINRQFKLGTVQKKYRVSYLIGEERSKFNFTLYDLDNGKLIYEPKLINKVYAPMLDQNDTVSVQFEKGLFGIIFQPTRFNEQ